MTVNKRELARELKRNIVTVGNWIDKWPDFPVVERGTNGREWQFLVADVLAFLQQRDEEQRAGRAERDEQLAQMFLPLTISDPDRASSGAAGAAYADPMKQLTYEARKAEERRKALADAQRRGELVDMADLVDTLSTIFSVMGRVLDRGARDACRDLNLPTTTVRSLQQRLDEARREGERELRRKLTHLPAISQNELEIASG